MAPLAKTHILLSRKGACFYSLCFSSTPTKPYTALQDRQPTCCDDVGAPRSAIDCKLFTGRYLQIKSGRQIARIPRGMLG